MKRRQNKLLYKIWWICMISIFIVLGDVLLFWTFDLDLFQEHEIENMSVIAAVFLGLKYIICFISFLVYCHDGWSRFSVYGSMGTKVYEKAISY